MYNMDIYQQQQGGKVLSEGAFGCVFTPRISCYGKKTKDKEYISKIQAYDITAENEIDISRKITDNTTNLKLLFAPIEKTCNINVNKIEDGEKQQCNVFKKSKKKYINMKIRFVDKLTFFDYMKMEDKNNSFNIFIDNYNYLLESINKLNEINIVHMDLKGNNILMNTVKNIPIIIDFGLSIDVNKLLSVPFTNNATKPEQNLIKINNKTQFNKDYLKECFYVYGPDYYVWCPEIHYINYLMNVKSNPDKRDIKNIVNDIIKNDKIMKRVYNKKTIKQYEKDMYDYLVKFYNIPKYEAIRELFKHYHSWDLYSLTLIFLRILGYIKNINNNIYKSKFFKTMSKLFLKNINPNPEKRLTVKQNKDTIIKYFYKKSFNDEKFLLEISKHYLYDDEKSIKMINQDEDVLNEITKQISK